MVMILFHKCGFYNFNKENLKHNKKKEKKINLRHHPFYLFLVLVVLRDTMLFVFHLANSLLSLVVIIF